MRLAEVVAASRSVAGTSGRLEKIGHLAELLRRTPPDEIEIVVGFLTGEPRQAGRDNEKLGLISTLTE